MKKVTKLLPLLLAFGLLIGCANNGGGNNQNSESSSNGGSSSGDSYNFGPGDQSQQSSDPDQYEPIEHAHSFDSAWASDADNHWHKCKADLGGAACLEIDGKAAHTWDNGTVITEPGAYSVGKKQFKCTVCNYIKNEAIPATGGNEPAGSFTFDESALSTAQEIHTANQKKYLNLGIQYYNITASNLDSCNAKGNSNQSTPNKVTVSWNYTAPSGKTVSKFQLLYGQRSDLGDAYTVEGTTANSISFYNPYLGDNYFKVIT